MLVDAGISTTLTEGTAKMETKYHQKCDEKSMALV